MNTSALIIVSFGGDECNEGAHAEYETLLEALEVHPEVERIEY
jgi:hypothetical protein